MTPRVDQGRYRVRVLRPVLARLSGWRPGLGQLVVLDGLVAAAGFGLATTRSWQVVPPAAGAAHGGHGPHGAHGTLASDALPPVLPVWLRYALVVAVCLPVAVRRLWPLPALAAVLPAGVASLLVATPNDAVLATALVLYLVALTVPGHRWAPLAVAGAVGAAAVAGPALSGVPAGAPAYAGLAVSACAPVAVSWVLGRAVRERRASATRVAEHLADRAVAEERLRIARELHDVVAHGMGLIAVKASVANHVLPARPEEATDALRVIETASRGALAEMRQLLGALRSAADDGGDEGGDLGPPPGPAGLPALVERTRVAGVQIEQRLSGLERLPEGLGLSVYRIVQEALTNVIKHAAPTTCQLTVDVRGAAVLIEVTDDGPGTPTWRDGGGGGSGLVGMRERVALYGGTFAAGPRPGGGFRVAARLPYRPVPEAR
jgi:signal transduction histidine kinase